MKRVTVQFGLSGTMIVEASTKAEGVARFVERSNDFAREGISLAEVTASATVVEILDDPRPPKREEYLGTVSDPEGPIHIFASTRSYGEAVAYFRHTEPTFWTLDELRGQGGWHEIACKMLERHLERARQETA